MAEFSSITGKIIGSQGSIADSPYLAPVILIAILVIIFIHYHGLKFNLLSKKSSSDERRAPSP